MSIILNQSKSKRFLKQKNGKFWLNDKGKKIPAVCPRCGEKVSVKLRGEPVFLCDGKDAHYFGTVAFPESLEV